ncbi:MAG: phosphatidate cytidylyltransferase [Phycisphaerae bacterium]
MLRYRLLLGILFAVLLIGLVALDRHMAVDWPRGMSWPPGLIVALIAIPLIIIAVREMRGLLSKVGVDISVRLCTTMALLCMLWPWAEQISQKKLQDVPGFWGHWITTVKPHYLTPTILAFTLVAAMVMHSRKQRIDGTIGSTGGALLAVVYLGVLPGFYLPICLSYSAWMLLLIIAIVKSADIGAYVTGHLLGRHKLIPWLSPGKTVEGFFGGLLFSTCVGMLLAWWYPPTVWWQGGAAGLLLGAVGQMGDLLESLLKRDAGVKDSGVVPGFGGVLDILDSPLLAAPLAYWLLKIMVVVPA